MGEKVSTSQKLKVSFKKLETHLQDIWYKVTKFIAD